jgi:hypothetical protein
MFLVLGQNYHRIPNQIAFILKNEPSGKTLFRNPQIDPIWYASRINYVSAHVIRVAWLKTIFELDLKIIRSECHGYFWYSIF